MNYDNSIIYIKEFNCSKSFNCKYTLFDVIMVAILEHGGLSSKI